MLRLPTFLPSRKKLLSVVWLAALPGLAGCETETTPERVDLQTKQTAIIGGKLAPNEESVVGVVSFVQGPGGGFGIGSCTGAFIADNVVLTAKHCVQDPGADGPRSPSMMFVLLGPEMSQNAPRLNVKSVVTTPGSYSEMITSDFIGKDVAVLTLASSSGVKALPMKLTSPVDEKGRDAFAVGYGQSRGRDPSSPTQQAGLKYSVDTKVADVQDVVIQVDDTTCQGDSGGPLISADGKVIGVVSYGPGSVNMNQCVNGPGFYNRIDIHSKMILDAIAAACSKDQAEVCDGFDNDCDKQVDETCADNGKACTDDKDCKSLLCADTEAGSVCTTACDPHGPTSGCAEGFVCTSQKDCSGLCVPGELGKKAFGAACTSNLECVTGFCHDPGNGSSVCLTTCTGGESMCLFDEACVAAAGKCGSCLDESLVAGKRGQDEVCTDKTMCQSGLCFDDGGSKYCANTCKSDAECDGDHHCRDQACVRGTRPDVGGRCEKLADCSKGQFCATTEQGKFCTETCKADSDCSKDFSCTKVTNGSACLPNGSVVGGPCTSDDECLAGTCFTPSKTCTTVCSSPTDCGAGLECVRSAEGAPGLCLSAKDASLAPLGQLDPEDADGGVPGSKKSSDGCSVAREGNGPGSLLALAGLGLVALVRRRRHHA